MTTLNSTLARVTDRITERSRDTRAQYLDRTQRMALHGPVRKSLACTNQAHAFAAFDDHDKNVLKEMRWPSIAIVSAYNDMLSAHQPFETYPQLIKQAVRQVGAVAQFAGGVPAMCDGVTQGQPGMEMSLFSRDVIALATAVSLSHNTFDGVLMLGICDKIVPGLVMGALKFGHLPVILVPGGPMPSGLPNEEKAKVRQLYAEGKVGRDALLESELSSYHSPGTCTFFGTANSNQMLMEIMGLHVPGAAFPNPNTPLRDALTEAAAQRVAKITALGDEYIPMAKVVDEKAIVNAIIGLLATGGSTNHTIHLIAMAQAAGVRIDWGDFAELSKVIPLLAKVYPNGKADVNHFQAAGGMGFLIGQLLDAGLLHEDVHTVAGPGLSRYREEPVLADGRLSWRPAPAESGDPDVLTTADKPFSATGGLQLLSGNLGRAVIKVSAVKPEHRIVEAPARVFNDQEDVMAAFERGELHQDVIVVVRFQGPRANGMPELHKLTPPLGVLQGLGYKVALVTDGRMSGASGKVPAAIHVTPEVLAGGPLGKVRDGDVLRLDAEAGVLEAQVESAEWAARAVDRADLDHYQWGLGRELFDGFRSLATGAEQGAMSFYSADAAPEPIDVPEAVREATADWRP